MALGSISLMKRLLRPLFTRMARSLGVLDVQIRMDDLTRRVSAYETGYENGKASLDQLASRKATEAVRVGITTLWDQVVDRDNAAQEAVMTASREHTELVVNEIRAHLENEIIGIKRGVDLIRSASGTTGPVQKSDSSQKAATSSSIDDSLYVALEDHFRGDPSVIRQRQLAYLPYVEGVVTVDKPLLDLGCGRGEWLTVLRDKGIAARGIDSNRACIDDCKQLELDVELADLIDYLNSLPDGSLGAVTMFQVLEHLPFNVLLNVMRSILRVLTPGGIFIGEVPNSETLRVGASTFWIDPTHERPLFPGLLRFLASEIGFKKEEGVYSSPLLDEPDVSSLPNDVQETFLAMFRQLNGAGDFALIATA
jgi:O-antigen chain-terminating methyltransferase